jgi:hypothetical protein
LDITPIARVELLFVVDNSSSMGQEQAALAAALPRAIRVLASGDFEPDGDLDFEPVEDLNVGVITTDMGVGGAYGIPACGTSGDDGVLRAQGNTDAGCRPVFPDFLQFRSDRGEDPLAFASDVTCVAAVGIEGCDFGQPLEASLEACSPSVATAWTAPGFTPPTFLDDTHGKADFDNEGFFHEHAILAIVPISDEDDCSVRDPELFGPTSVAYADTPLGLRCFEHADAALHPISRYVDGLLQLRTRPGLLVYAPLVGIPPDLAPAPGEHPDFARLVSPDLALRDDRMEPRVDPAMPSRLVSSCSHPARGGAFPPVRIVRAAHELHSRGAAVTVQSICADDYDDAFSEIIRQIASGRGAPCLFRPLATLEPICELTAVLPEATPCESVPGAAPELACGEPLIEDGRAVCVLPQLFSAGVPPAGSGWYYDDFSAEVISACGAGARRVALTVTLPAFTALHMKCRPAHDI